MALRVYKEPVLKNPDLIAAWPGIGNIGLIAVDTLRKAVNAEPFAEIEPWHFFYPHGVTIQDGELVDINFPKSRFFYKKLDGKDTVFFVGEEQPAGGRKGYEMANLILDMAALMRCGRIYTAAAAVTTIHHTAKPKVWAVPNNPKLVDEIKQYPNTILMSSIDERGGQGNITGLNGLLLGVAQQRGMEGICLLGEIPVYVSQFLTPYPKASRSILDVINHNLGIAPDLSKLDEMDQGVEQNIERFYTMIPQEMRDHIDQLQQVTQAEQENQDKITDEDKKEIMQHIEEFFEKGGQED
ncbi:MAG: hypothetical protein HOC20_07810 [Chloroflexi bacterium]|jgi:uncharacterized protein|nr:hypothetical protein [Chloroflexota bacterium]